MHEVPETEVPETKTYAYLQGSVTIKQNEHLKSRAKHLQQ